MKFISRLNQRLGETVRNNVVLDIANERFSGANKVSLATQIVAIIIVSTPYVLGAFGLLLLIFGFPEIAMLALGGLLLAIAIYLRPRAIRNKLPTLKETDAPTLLALLDQISHELGAPKIDGVQVLSAFNAYVADYKPQERVVGIGAPLWISLDPDERLAILAHEVAHLANNDPARGTLTGAAMDTLARWNELFSPPSLIDQASRTEIIIDDRGIVAQLIGGLFGSTVNAIALAYEKLIFAESQRAEYLADIMAASVSGAPAMQSALKKIILAPLAEDFVLQSHYDGSKELRVFEGMANAVRSPNEGAANKLYAEAIESLHSVDQSHPPTRYRIEVVGALDQGVCRLQAGAFDWQRIDDELSDAVATAENAMLADMLVQ